MKLLETFTLSNYKLKNRMVMAPMTRSRASSAGIVSELTPLYYSQRASAGLIITEGTNISPAAVGYPNTPGIWLKEHVAAWRKVTKAVHEKGGLIFLQLWHTGRVSHPLNQGGNTPLAPSAIRPEGVIFTTEGLREFVTPVEMTQAEIKKTVQEYKQGAVNAIDAGFDGVEVHGAFGYLPQQFLSSGSNRRTDEYGGSIENRSRFVIELMAEICKAIGSEKVGIKLSPSGRQNSISDYSPVDLYNYLITALNRFNLAYLHLMEPSDAGDDLPVIYPREVAKQFRELCDCALISNGCTTTIQLTRLSIRDLPTWCRSENFFSLIPICRNASEFMQNSIPPSRTPFMVETVLDILITHSLNLINNHVFQTSPANRTYGL